MLEGISNTVASLPLASIGCTAAGLYLGRRWCEAGIYQAGRIGANIVGSKNAAEWDQASEESLKHAKKDGNLHLIAAVSLVAIGLYPGPVHDSSKSILPFALLEGIACFSLGAYQVSSKLFHKIGKEITWPTLLCMMYNPYRNEL